MLKESIAALLFAGLSVSALADDLLVPSQYPTIQAAIDAAVDGDQIVIAAGTYRELLDGQNKSLSYTGAGMGQTILSGDLDNDGVPDGDVLFVNDNTATEYPSIAMADLTIRDALTGVSVYQLDQGSFVRCEVAGTTNNGIGDHYLGSTILIDECVLHSNNNSIFIGGHSANTPAWLVIKNSTLRDSERAAYLDRLTVVISNTSISGHSRRAVTVDYGSLSLFNCNVHSNLSGGIKTRGADIHIADSIFENNIADGAIDLNNKTGGAIFMGTAADTADIQRTVFRRNSSSHSGGAISVDATNTEIRDCLFEENSSGFVSGYSPGLGAAIDLFTDQGLIKDCDFIRNRGEGTGPLNMSVGVFGIRVIKCNFIGNGRTLMQGETDDSRGGGLCIERGNAIIEDCLFQGNRAGSAGAIMTSSYSYRAWVNGCRFYANTAQGPSSLAGAILANRRSWVSQSVFVGNKAINGQGGAIAGSVRGDTPPVDSCVFYDNKANRGTILVGDADTISSITNSLAIVENRFNNFVTYQNDGNLHFPISPTNIVTTNHESIGFVRLPNHGGDGWGDDPTTPDIDEGANDDFGDLRLTAHSPAIDAGSNADIPLDTRDIDNDGDNTEPITGAFDMDGNPRFVDTLGMPNVYPANELGGPIDLGAYEFQGTSCHADVNGDGSLTPTDFTAWIGAFNTNNHAADQNRDGSITPTDFTAWIANFNAGCP